MLNPEQAQQIKARLSKLKITFGGKFLYYCLPFRRKVVLYNMRQVFTGVLNEKEIHQLALAFYSHLFMMLKETLSMRFMSQDQIKQRVIVIGKEYLENILADPAKGAILITGHFGSWEFAPIAGILNFKDHKGLFFFVRKTLKNKFLEKILFKRYHDAGLGVIPKKNSLMQVYQTLENNKIIVFVMDQHASIRAKDGIWVDFFGRKAGTFKSVAMIAGHTGTPVVPARSYRKADGQHVLEFFPPLPWLSGKDASEEVQINTRNYNRVLEDMILEYPEQWLWLHKRWKNS